MSSEDDPSSLRRRSSVSGSDKISIVPKRSIDETDTETDEPTNPANSKTDEAQPEVDQQKQQQQQQQQQQQASPQETKQPAKKRKSTSSDDDLAVSSTSAVMSPTPLLNMPSFPCFNFTSPGTYFPLFPFMMPNQFPNVCATDFQLCTSVNIDRPSNEIFEASEPGPYPPL